MQNKRDNPIGCYLIHGLMQGRRNSIANAFIETEWGINASVI